MISSTSEPVGVKQAARRGERGRSGGGGEVGDEPNDQKEVVEDQKAAQHQQPSLSILTPLTTLGLTHCCGSHGGNPIQSGAPCADAARQELAKVK